MAVQDIDEALLLSDKIVMLTNGSAVRVGEVLVNEFPRPRDRLALANNAKFPSTGSGCWSSCIKSRKSLPTPSCKMAARLKEASGVQAR
jgi:ABC-type nitrate/sulfonate/bicarbonate transport system ATPase subunit